MTESSTRNLVRPPARAGQFYPADPQAIAQEVRAYLAAGQNGWDAESGVQLEAPFAVRAVMLPHAGWRYCGPIIGRGLASVAVPKRVIILGPRHTHYGPQLSAPTHDAWAFPGATVDVNQGIIAQLRARVPGLAHENEAHRLEHGCEVLVPFLHARRPDLQIVPIVLGRLNLATVRHLGEALAALLTPGDAGDHPAGEPPLLVISSDMNHFAPLPENRRRDQLALHALVSGDPERLVTTCHDNDISMCGMLPAAAVLVALRCTGKPPDVQVRGYATSAAVTGDATSVVGYASAVIR